MPRHATQEILLEMREFSRGIMGGVSERGIARPNWLAAADNLYGRPYRAMSVRPGSRDATQSWLTREPHSLMAFYSVAVNRLFVGNGPGIDEAQASGYAPQTLPAGNLASSDILSHTNLNGLLIVTQRGGNKVPLEYDGTSWKELALPTPAVTPTFGADTNVAGAIVDVGTHFYRVRHRYNNGSTVAGTPTAAHVVGAPNQQVNITGGLNPASPRDDYVGWTLERTKVNGSVIGPWWFLADGSTATYADKSADADLGYIADDGFHIAPPHFDGLAAFTGRLWGWAGSGLHASQVIGDVEATGISNFDPDLLYQIAKDDGDSIQTCLVVLDELLILKKRSVHIISGIDPESYVLTSVVYADPERGSEAGCAGPRSACVIGGKAYFWGDSGLFSYSRGTVRPEAWREMGHYIDEVNRAALDKLLLMNHQGDYMLAWYPRSSSPVAQDQLVLDARFGQWWHWNGWRASAAIALKGGLFDNAGLVIADPTDHGAFPTIVDGTEITDDYVVVGGMLIPVTNAIPPGTVVVGDVVAGATTLVMSNLATATVSDGSFIFGGRRLGPCSTTLGSSVMTLSPNYHLWVLFDSFLDEKTSTGQYGLPVSVMLETPWLDGGMPEDWKDVDRVSFDVEADQLPITISIATDPPGGDAALVATTDPVGADWAADSATSLDDLEWDVGDWAANSPTGVVSGVPSGTVGKRHKITISANADADFRPSGLAAPCVLLPDRDYDR